MSWPSKAKERLSPRRAGHRADRGESGTPNILPGPGAASPLVKFIAGEVEDMKMPPEGEPLAPAEIASFRAWVDAGAPWPDGARAAVPDPLDWWSLHRVASASVRNSAAGVCYDGRR